MIYEFERYRLSKFRFVTGSLQILGCIGLAIGFYNAWFALLASLGLALQMFLGVMVRIYIKDSLWQTVPAIFFCILNLFIFLRIAETLHLAKFL